MEEPIQIQLPSLPPPKLPSDSDNDILKSAANNTTNGATTFITADSTTAPVVADATTTTTTTNHSTSNVTTTYYTLEQVQAHNTPESCWIILGNARTSPSGPQVYDVTQYLDDHPGGVEVLLDVAGGDADEFFEDIGHSKDARIELQKHRIGALHLDADALAKLHAEAQKVKAKTNAYGGQQSSSSSFLGVLSSPMMIIAMILMAIAYSYYSSNMASSSSSSSSS